MNQYDMTKGHRHSICCGCYGNRNTNWGLGGVEVHTVTVTFTCAILIRFDSNNFVFFYLVIMGWGRGLA